MTRIASPLILVLLAALVVGATGAGAQPGSDPTSNEKQRAEIEKLRAEVKKLNEELEDLSTRNPVWIRRLTPFLTFLGGLAVAGVAFWASRRLNRTQEKKLEQDIQLGRERHNLELFKALGEREPRVRVGAASVLVPRLQELEARRKLGSDDSGQKREFDSIIKVLIAVTKHEDTDELQKYIADSLIDVLGATERTKGCVSPLKRYDFQGAKLTNAWWKGADLRGVDFYKATLSRAGMRDAHLEGAILKHADLSRATLRGAHLEEANLEQADLRGADLRGAHLAGAKFAGAKLQDAKLDPAQREGGELEGAVFGESSGDG